MAVCSLGMRFAFRSLLCLALAGGRGGGRVVSGERTAGAEWHRTTCLVTAEGK